MAFSMKKGGKVYTAHNEKDRDFYFKQGYDEVDKKGEVLTASPQKTYSCKEYDTLKKEYDTLKKEYDTLLEKMEVSDEKNIKEPTKKSKGS